MRVLLSLRLVQNRRGLLLCHHRSAHPPRLSFAQPQPELGALTVPASYEHLGQIRFKNHLLNTFWSWITTKDDELLRLPLYLFAVMGYNVNHTIILRTHMVGKCKLPAEFNHLPYIWWCSFPGADITRESSIRKETSFSVFPKPQKILIIEHTPRRDDRPSLWLPPQRRTQKFITCAFGIAMG